MIIFQVYGIIMTMVLTFTFHLGEGQDTIEFRTFTICYEKNKTISPIFTCNTDEFIIINKAYNGKKETETLNFCDNPQPDMKKDCIKFESQRTYELLVNCGRRSTCRQYLQFKELKCEARFKGNTYLAVQYACYTRYNNGSHKDYQYVIMNNNFDGWHLENRALIYTEQYPFWQNALDVSGACQVTLPPHGYLIVHVLDFSGKLIFMTDGCAAKLLLHDGQSWYINCGKLGWDYKNYTLRPASPPWRVDIILSTDLESSEARTQLLIEGFTSKDQYVENMNMTCGQHLTGLYTVPTTITPTTKSTIITTTKAPTTTTGILFEALKTSAQPHETSITTAELNIISTDNSKSVGLIQNTILVGSLIGGIVLLIVIILGIVLGCRQKTRNRQHAVPADQSFRNDIFAANGKLTDPRFKNANSQKDSRNNYNAYITNNTRHQTSSSTGNNMEEYAEIDDGSSPTHTWITDNRSLAVNLHQKPEPTITVNHDPSFDEPNETTLQLAKGTTRGFKF